MKLMNMLALFCVFFTLGLLVALIGLDSELNSESYRRYVLNAKTINDILPHQPDIHVDHTAYCTEDKQSPWQPGKSKHILMIGGLSFLGYHLTHQFLDNGNHVNIVDEFEDRCNNEMKRSRWEALKYRHYYRLAFTRGNACNHVLLQELFQRNKFTNVFYLYSDLNKLVLDPQEFADTTLTCFTVLLEMLKNTRNVSLALITTTSIYGSHQHERASFINEGLFRPKDVRAAILQSMEYIAHAYHTLYNIPFVIFRTSNIYGPFMDVFSVVHRLVECTLHQKHDFRTLDEIEQSQLLHKWLHDVTIIRGSQDFLHITDAVEQIQSELRYGHSCAAVDVTSNQPTRLDVILLFLYEVTRGISTPRHTQHLKAKQRPLGNLIDNMVYYTGFARQQTRLVTDLKTGLNDYVSWFESFRDQTIFTEDTSFILSSYFTTNYDPQRKIFLRKDRFGFMDTWYWSVQDIGARAVIIHDNLGGPFINAVSTDKITFSYSSLKRRSTNDARFYAYLTYLRENPNIHRIFLTDISDVKFQKNPFQLLEMLGDLLYIGRDIDIFSNMASMGWLKDKLVPCFGEESISRSDIASVILLNHVYNAGVIGGSRHVMLQFLEKVTDVLDNTPRDVNCNMPVVNYVVHKYFDDRVYTGFPLTSRFMTRKKSAKGVYILHK
ncbi:uncharacterized protein LOC144356047 [Saccoglossus kowalevskii]